MTDPVAPPAPAPENKPVAGDVVVRLPEAAVNKLIDIFSQAFSKAGAAHTSLPPPATPPADPAAPGTPPANPPAPATPPKVDIKVDENKYFVRRGGRLIERTRKPESKPNG